MHDMATATLTAEAAFAAALRGERCRLTGVGNRSVQMPMRRWRRAADAADHVFLSHCVGATIDIGCGPGRMTHALLCRGLPSLGIDINPEAIRQTRDRGALALRRDVFSRIPGEGRWQTALLADGNVGIGGDPVRLLRRVRDLITANGRIVVDLGEPGGTVRAHRVRLEVAGQRSQPFMWAVVPATSIEALANQASLRVLELVAHEARWFATLALAR
jgi:SAM-dependent methyltransferase